MKKFIIGFVFILIIILLGSHFFLKTDSAVYVNKTYNYQVTLPKGWTLPPIVNSYIDLYRKYLNEKTYSEIFDESSSTGLIVKDKARLAELDEKTRLEMKTWNPFTAEFVMFTNATEKEQVDFYTAVNQKEKNLVTDFFPTRTITIEPSDYMSNLISTTTMGKTATRIARIIDVNGIKSQYEKLINPTIGSSVVFIPVVIDKLDYNGHKIVAFKISSRGNELSDETFMKMVNSFVFLGQ